MFTRAPPEPLLRTASYQFTTRVKVVVWMSVPDVAVTVTVEVLVCDPPPEEPPPHPLARPRPVRLMPSNKSNGNPFLFLNPTKQSTPANAASGRSGRRFSCELADVAAVVTVRVVVAAAGPDGVSVAGEKLHAAPAGTPEHANETAEANELCGEIEIVAVPLPPAVTVIVTGAAVTEKSGGTLMMYAALATALLLNSATTAIAFSVSEFATVIALLYKVELVVGVVPSVV